MFDLFNIDPDKYPEFTKLRAWTESNEELNREMVSTFGFGNSADLDGMLDLVKKYVPNLEIDKNKLIMESLQIVGEIISSPEFLSDITDILRESE